MSDLFTRASGLYYYCYFNRSEHLKDIPESGVAGKWKSSVAKNGYVTREVFLEILADLVKHLEEKNIPRPVVLFMDGYSGHLGPEISDFATKNGIALRLLRYFV